MIRLKLLGGARLERDGRPVDGPASQRLRLGLLAVLGTSGGGVSRDRVLSLLWPDADPDRARHALNNALYAVRSALGEGVVVSAGDELRLDPRLIEVDAALFEQAVREQDLEAAARLYEGPFLDGFALSLVPFERWTDSVRDRLAAEQARVLETLADRATDPREAVEWWRRFANHDPYSSHGAAAYMGALEAAGDPGGALRHARVHAALLAGELEVGPDAEVEALASRIEARMAEASAASGAPEDGAVDPEARRSDTGPPGGETGALPEPESGSAPPPGRRPANPPRRAGRRPSTRDLVLGGVVAATAVLAAMAINREERGLRAPGSVDPTTMRSLAVLPLENVSRDEGEAYFAEGMTEVLTAELSRLGGLTVVSRTSASRFADSELTMPEIARQLGVDGVVEGSVFRSGDRVRVTAQLIHGPTDGHLWAESYEGSVDDAIGLQRRVARAVAGALALTLTPGEAARLSGGAEASPEAQDAFFRGLHRYRRFTPESVREALLEFHRAAELAPDWADAAALLGQSYWILTQPLSAMPATEGMPSAREWARRAVDLDPSMGLGHSSLGWVALFYDWDAENALEHFEQAIRAWPRGGAGYNGRAFVRMVRGDAELALQDGRRAAELDRLDLSFSTALAEIHYLGRRYDEALAELDRVHDLDPGFTRAYAVRRWVHEARADWEAAVDAFHREMGSASIADDASNVGGEARHASSASAYWDWRIAWLTRDPAAPVDPALLAWAHAEAGHPDQAFQFLERAVEARSGQMVFLGVQPAWDDLRGDPRFADLLERVGLPAGS